MAASTWGYFVGLFHGFNRVRISLSVALRIATSCLLLLSLGSSVFEHITDYMFITCFSVFFVTLFNLVAVDVSVVSVNHFCACPIMRFKPSLLLY